MCVYQEIMSCQIRLQRSVQLHTMAQSKVLRPTMTVLGRPAGSTLRSLAV